MSDTYSDLQVVPPSDFSGLQPHLAETDLRAAESDTYKIHDVDSYKIYDPVRQDAEPPSSLKNRRFCGLGPRKMFTIATVLGILFIIGGIGGGIGGTALSKNRRTSPAPLSSSGPADTPNTIHSENRTIIRTAQVTTTPTTTSTTPSLTTIRIVGPSTTLFRDCPSSNNTTYDVVIGSSKKQSFRKLYGLAFARGNNMGQNVVNRATQSLNDCIHECATYNSQNATQGQEGKTCDFVCWRNGLDGDDFPGQCFGFPAHNSATEDVIQQQAKCDSGMWLVT